ncbi:MAG: ParB/RepB/Spo0J family partition protein [Acidobacteriia bacterium]|nr:ParB/RepB/Spo0J family partition protein [Terriglobia bacterium]
MSTSAIEQRPTAAPPPPDSETASVNIPLSKIVPSKTNPGRSYDAARDSEMVESIRAHAVLQPILLRTPGVKGSSFQIKGAYEIVAGERRYHCSLKAGRTHISAVVRELTDIQALEIQTIENDQREDLDPLGKSAAYARLRDAYLADGLGDYKKRMVERLGRKERTVEQTLSLGNLSKQGQNLLANGDMSLSHAYEVCRRTAAEQKRILDWYEHASRYSKVSVRDLKDHIREECNHFLDAAPFDKKDPKLFPGAGACTDCQKNTAVNPNLVDPEDLKGKNGGKRAICTDGDCWKTKVSRNLVQIEEAAKKAREEVIHVSTSHAPPKGAKAAGDWKEVKPGSCQYSGPGLILDGKQRGTEIEVCIATNVCKEHWGRDVEPNASRIPSRPRSEAEKKAMLQKQRNKKLDQAFRIAATAQLRKSVKSLKDQDLKDVALAMFEGMDRRLRNPVLAAMGWKTSTSWYGPSTPAKQIAALKPPDVAAFMALMAIADNVLPGLPDYIGRDSKVQLQPFAKRHKVNLVKIHKAAAAPLQANWRVIDARKKAAKAKPKPKAKAKPAQTIAKVTRASATKGILAHIAKRKGKAKKAA